MATDSSVAFLLLCLCGIPFVIEALNLGFSVELIHRDSPRSPFYRPNESQSQRVANAISRSINHDNHFFQASTPTSIVTPGRGEYLMSYSVGTPPFEVFGIVGTGSDIVWLQCKPCKNCFNQTSPMFDPSKSTTYKTIPCSSNTCKSVHNTSCSSDSKQICKYIIEYDDDSHSAGDLVLETVTLSSTSGSPVPFPKIVIGCGFDNSLLFQGHGSGVVGLGGGPVSLISQLGPSIGGKFSYCLVPLFSESQFTSKLNFGDSTAVSGKGTLTTPIVPQDPSIFYFLTLEAFSVGDKRVEFESSSFGNSKGNIIIGTGTTLTLLPNDLYSRFESTIADAIKLEPVQDPTKQLSLCYKTTSGKLEVPIIIAHFSGADLQLNALNTFVQVDDEVMCLAFASTQSFATFGNLAQQNFLVGYDLKKKIVSFLPTDCTKN